MKTVQFKLIKKILLGLLALIISLFIIGYLAFYFFVQTNLDYYKNELVNEISKATNKTVTIKTFDANWNITNPRFIIKDFSIYADSSEKAFTFEKFEVDVSWMSLLKFELVLDQVTLYNLAVEIQKNSETDYLIGGWKVSYEPNSNNEFDGKLINWLLNQDEVQMINAKIIWIDKTRANSPPLVLNDINLSYSTSDILSYLDRHLFYLDFFSSAGTKEKISLSGHFDADSINELLEADGALSFKFDALNLYAFSPWIDYPLTIKDGTGSLSINIEFENGKLKEGGSSFSIQNLNANTIDNAKQGLVFKDISGEFEYELVNDDVNIILDNLFLTTNSKLQFEDSAASIKYNFQTNQINKAKLVVDRFDLGSVQEISNQFLPEEHRVNVIINKLQARGEIDDLKLKWYRTSDEEEPNLKLKAKFLELEINEFESFPGLKNITGEVNIENEKGIIRSVSRDVKITKEDVFRAPLQLNQFTGSVIRELNNNNIKLNITAVYNSKQTEKILKIINKNTKVIISIFAGRAGDTGKDPVPEFKRSIRFAKKFKNVEILWASVREPYNYLQSKQIGCHIITVPPSIIEKIEKFGKTFDQLTKETVKAFLVDSQKSKFKI